MRISDWSSDVCSSDLCNVTDDASVDAAFAKAREAHGQERILVNCAGTGNAIKTASRSKADGSIKHFPLDAFTWIIQINLVGPFRCLSKSAAGMLTPDRTSGVQGKSTSGRVGIGGSRTIKK